MQEVAVSSVAVVSPLIPWVNFYVIIGSASAALTGLMFVVMALIAGSQVQRSHVSIAAFGTPTVVHFCVALFVAVNLTAPWQVLWNAGLLLGLAGLGGFIYVVIVARRARSQSDYQPVMEDRLWHTVFPLFSYSALVVAAIMLSINPTPTLFVIGAATTLFLFIGIHNSWDSVEYLVIEQPGREDNRPGEKL